MNPEGGWQDEGFEGLDCILPPPDCKHFHCPFEHDHPQPLELRDMRLLCGACWHKDQEAVDMVECTPTLCGGEA